MTRKVGPMLAIPCAFVLVVGCGDDDDGSNGGGACAEICDLLYEGPEYDELLTFCVAEELTDMGYPVYEECDGPTNADECNECVDEVGAPKSACDDAYDTCIEFH